MYVHALRPRRLSTSSVVRFGLGAALVLSVPAGVSSQVEGATLPFSVGEVLTYQAVSSRFGTFGSGTMRVDGPEQVQSQATYRLSFDFRGRVGPFRVEDQTRSWLVPGEMLSLRYEKHERSPLGTRREQIAVYPSEQRWSSAAGSGGRTATSAPLDELSFLYYLRSIPLEVGQVYDLTRHFDPARNPVVIRVLRRETTRVPAGEFATVAVEMRVKDTRASSGEGVLVLYLTDDARRIPVRIESSAPWVGRLRLLLESATTTQTAAR